METQQQERSLKPDGTIVLGMNEYKEVVFAKTFDFDEHSKVEEKEAFAAMDFVRKNFPYWSIGDTLHSLNNLNKPEENNED